MFFIEMRVMLVSFSPMAVELSDIPQFSGFWGSSDSLFFRHLNLRLTTLTRIITTTTSMMMKVMTPNAATVSTVSDVGVGKIGFSVALKSIMVDLGIMSEDVTAKVGIWDLSRIL